jgi:hypothetical protein
MNATARRILTAALFIWGAYDLAHPGRGTLLDGVDLAIHETGHLVFNPFGEFIGFAGGTLFQLIVPVIFLGYFWRRGDRHAASVALWWVGQNCGHIATYVADARAQELPLVGGGEHDWFYLLSATRHLPDDLAIARAIRSAGVLLLVSSTVWGLIAAGRRAEDVPETTSLPA